MVETGSGSSYQQFVFTPDGNPYAIYNAGTSTLMKATVPLPGGDTAIYNQCGLSYLRHTDWLASSRLATTWAHAVYSKEAYAPFGETYNEAGTADRSFTGQDQDVVSGSGGTGAYDFLYRKHDPSAGRWLSPDPDGWKAVSLAYPQTLNRYTYVLNSPLNHSDPNGKECVWDNGSYDSEGDTETGTPGQCQGQGGTWIELGQGGNWSDSPNSVFAQTVANIQSGYWTNVAVVGANGQMNYTFYNGNGMATMTDKGGVLSLYAYGLSSTAAIFLTDYSDPDGAWAKTYMGSAFTPLVPTDQDQVIQQLANGVNFQLYNPLGLTIQQSVCNLSTIALTTGGLLVGQGGFAEAGYTSVGEAAASKAYWMAGAAGGGITAGIFVGGKC